VYYTSFLNRVRLKGHTRVPLTLVHEFENLLGNHPHLRLPSRCLEALVENTGSQLSFDNGFNRRPRRRTSLEQASVRRWWYRERQRTRELRASGTRHSIQEVDGCVSDVQLRTIFGDAPRCGGIVGGRQGGPPSGMI
jgi:hypothetical protein